MFSRFFILFLMFVSALFAEIKVDYDHFNRFLRTDDGQFELCILDRWERSYRYKILQKKVDGEDHYKLFNISESGRGCISLKEKGLPRELFGKVIPIEIEIFNTNTQEKATRKITMSFCPKTGPLELFNVKRKHGLYRMGTRIVGERFLVRSALAMDHDGRHYCVFPKGDIFVDIFVDNYKFGDHYYEFKKKRVFDEPQVVFDNYYKTRFGKQDSYDKVERRIITVKLNKDNNWQHDFGVTVNVPLKDLQLTSVPADEHYIGMNGGKYSEVLNLAIKPKELLFPVGVSNPKPRKKVNDSKDFKIERDVLVAGQRYKVSFDANSTGLLTTNPGLKESYEAAGTEDFDFTNKLTAYVDGREKKGLLEVHKISTNLKDRDKTVEFTYNGVGEVDLVLGSDLWTKVNWGYHDTCLKGYENIGKNSCSGMNDECSCEFSKIWKVKFVPKEIKVKVDYGKNSSPDGLEYSIFGNDTYVDNSGNKKETDQVRFSVEAFDAKGKPIKGIGDLKLKYEINFKKTDKNIKICKSERDLKAGKCTGDQDTYYLMPKIKVENVQSGKSKVFELKDPENSSQFAKPIKGTMEAKGDANAFKFGLNFVRSPKIPLNPLTITENDVSVTIYDENGEPLPAQTSGKADFLYLRANPQPLMSLDGSKESNSARVYYEAYSRKKSILDGIVSNLKLSKTNVNWWIIDAPGCKGNSCVGGSDGQRLEQKDITTLNNVFDLNSPNSKRPLPPVSNISGISIKEESGISYQLLEFTRPKPNFLPVKVGATVALKDKPWLYHNPQHSDTDVHGGELDEKETKIARFFLDFRKDSTSDSKSSGVTNKRPKETKGFNRLAN